MRAPARSKLPLLLLGAALIATSGCGDPLRLELPPGMGPAHLAAAKDDESALRNLARAERDKSGPFGWTPLHVASIYGSPLAARLLITSGARVNATDQSGMTPLHWAALNGHAMVVDALLKGRAEIKARNGLDRTPLHEARTVAVAELLLAKGAPLAARDKEGMTPLHTAATRKVAQLLIAKGADTNARARDGRTPLSMPPTARPRVR